VFSVVPNLIAFVVGAEEEWGRRHIHFNEQASHGCL